VPAVHTRLELEAGEEDVLVEVTCVVVEVGWVDVLLLLLLDWVRVDVLLVEVSVLLALVADWLDVEEEEEPVALNEPV